MNEIVKYHNDFNKIKLPSFTEQEQNLLYGILTRIKDNETNTIKFLPSELMEFTTQNYTNKELGDILYILRDKFFKADFMILIEDKEREMIGKEWINLFETFKLWYPKGDKEYNHLLSVEMKVNPRFTYLVNELTANFTRFELAEFIAISGKYTKTLYRLLKQYRNTGYLKMEWSEFKRILDIPECYRQIDIDQQILKPAIKELTKERNLFDITRIPFENLTYTKLKGKGRGRGGNVIGIEFSFKKQTDFLTKDEQIKFLKAGYEELATEAFKNNMAQAENQELKERIEKLEKISYGIGLNAYCGLKYYSDKGETLRVLDLMDIPNSSDSNRYKAEILNEKTKETFFIYLESLKHLMNIISKNEADLIIHNQEIINRRIKSNS